MEEPIYSPTVSTLPTSKPTNGTAPPTSDDDIGMNIAAVAGGAILDIFLFLLSLCTVRHVLAWIVRRLESAQESGAGARSGEIQASQDAISLEVLPRYSSDQFRHVELER